ncbi:MAG: hypothetical protein ACU83U_09545 [Gammaproteobacteria bacterium]
MKKDLFVPVLAIGFATVAANAIAYEVVILESIGNEFSRGDSRINFFYNKPFFSKAQVC